MSKPGNVVCDGDVCRMVCAPAGIATNDAGISTKDEGSNPITALLGNTLLGPGGTTVTTESICGPGKYVALYFSAHWCPPCRRFTPLFAQTYNKVKESHAVGPNFEVVFVSSDRDEASYAEYFKEMPWLGLPYVERDTKAKLSKQFKVQGIPTLVILDGATGKLITANGVESVMEDPDFSSFPWNQGFAESIKGDLVDKHGAKHDALATLHGKVKLVYFSAHWCPPCRGFTPVLVEVYNKLKSAGKAIEIVFVSGDRDKGQFDSYLSEMPWLAIPFEDSSRKKLLNRKFEVQGIPALVVLDENDKVITTDGRTAVMQDPEGTSFPWVPPAMAMLSEYNISGINESAAVMYLLASSDEAAAKVQASKVLLGVAEEYMSSGGDDLVFFYGVQSDELVQKVMGFAGVEVSDSDSLLVLDIPSQEVYLSPHKGSEISAEVINKFVSDFKQGTLTGNPIQG